MQNDFAKWQLQQEDFAFKQTLQLPQTWDVHCKKVLYFHSKRKVARKRQKLVGKKSTWLQINKDANYRKMCNYMAL